MKKISFIAAAALYILITQHANAVTTITSPYVKKGKHQISTDGYYAVETDNSSDYKFRERITSDFGVTEDIGLRFRVTGEQDDNRSFESSYFEAALKYEIGNKGENLIDSALYFSFIQQTYGADDSIAQFKYLFGKETTKWKHLGNLNFQKTFGDDFSDTGVSLYLSSLKKLDDDFSLGYQYFGEFGNFGNLDVRNEKHSIGPWLSYTQPTYTADLGVQLGLTNEERDVTVQWRLSVPFTSL